MPKCCKRRLTSSLSAIDLPCPRKSASGSLSREEAGEDDSEEDEPVEIPLFAHGTRRFAIVLMLLDNVLCRNAASLSE